MEALIKKISMLFSKNETNPDADALLEAKQEVEIAWNKFN